MIKMPMKSQAQRKFLHTVHPQIAAKFEAHTPKHADLPKKLGESRPASETVKKKKKKGEK